MKLSFNSRPCERGDNKFGKLFGDFCVSIHAPARGATLYNILPKMSRLLFQFTPLREGRPKYANNLLAKISVSIHAPARGAT